MKPSDWQVCLIKVTWNQYKIYFLRKIIRINNMCIYLLPKLWGKLLKLFMATFHIAMKPKNNISAWLGNHVLRDLSSKDSWHYFHLDQATNPQRNNWFYLYCLCDQNEVMQNSECTKVLLLIKYWLTDPNNFQNVTIPLGGSSLDRQSTIPIRVNRWDKSKGIICFGNTCE